MVINPQQGHCASAAITAPALEGSERNEVWGLKCIESTNCDSPGQRTFTACVRAVADMLISLIVS